MSDLTIPSSHTENLELLANNRRLTTAVLGMVLVTGLVGCLAYLAGRTVTFSNHINSREAAGKAIEAKARPTVVVDPLPAKPAAPATAQAAVPAKAPQSSAVPAAPAVPAGDYLQVGLMNPAYDKSMQQRLEALGFHVELFPMEGANAFRVLVGPIKSSVERQEFEKKLQASGFQFFNRRVE